MSHFRKTGIVCVIVLSAASARALWAELPPPLPEVPALPQEQGPEQEQGEARPESSFLRFVDEGRAGGRLETGVVTYRNADGVTVRLVAAVHIGEKSYFEDLARGFEADDAVLYEMVKAKDAAPPGPDSPPSGSGVSELQRFLKDTLNLSFQLDVIDYTRPNFVHADLDAETFQKMQAERGESLATLMLQQMMRAMAQPPEGGPDAQAQQDPEQMLRELVHVIARPDMERQMKLLLARHMTDIENSAAGLGLDNSVILTERNKAAVKVLADTVASGKKHISVFYGAAHMPDLDERLRAMGFKPVATEWKLAWDLAIRADQPSAIEQFLEEAIESVDKVEVE